MVSHNSDSDRLSSRQDSSRRLPKHPLWFRLALYFAFGVSVINWVWVNSSSSIL